MHDACQSQTLDLWMTECVNYRPATPLSRHFSPSPATQIENRAPGATDQRNLVEFSVESVDRLPPRGPAAVLSEAGRSFSSPGEWLLAPASDRTWQFVAPFKNPEPRVREEEPAFRGVQYGAAMKGEPGLTRAEVARRFGVSRAAVTQALRRCGQS
jgi:hypothetical protein